MKGPDQLPSDGDKIITHVGTGLEKPAKVRAMVIDVDEEYGEIVFKVEKVIEEGSIDVDMDTYKGDTDGFLWWEA